MDKWFDRARLGAIFCLAGAMCGGCLLAGYAAHVYGEPPVPAQYTLAARPTAIVVEDAPDPTGENIESEVLASQIEQYLAEHKIGPIVPSVKVSDLHSSDPNHFATMSPAQIGQAVGAEQVVFVQVLHSTVSAGEGNDMLKGQIAGVASVWDVASEKLLWPTDGSAGETVTYATPMLRASEVNTPQAVRRNIYAGLADKVAKLFYKYKPDED